MAFVSWSFFMDGPIQDDKDFSEEHTYITVFGTTFQSEAVKKCYRDIHSMFDVIYEGPLAFNHYHAERNRPSQRIIIFEKKCPQEPSRAPDVLPKEKTLEVTT